MVNQVMLKDADVRTSGRCTDKAGQCAVLSAQQGLARTAHLFNGCCACKRPQVCIRDPGELDLDWLQQVARYLQPSVSAIVTLFVPVGAWTIVS